MTAIWAFYFCCRFGDNSRVNTAEPKPYTVGETGQGEDNVAGSMSEEQSDVAVVERVADVDRKPTAAPSASPTLPPRRAKVHALKDTSTGSLDQKRKLGTAADAKWNNYSVSAKGLLRRKSSSSLQLATLTRVERMRAVIPISKRPRIAIIFLLSILVCMIKEGEHMQLPNQETFLESRQRMIGSCSHVISAGLKSLTVGSAVTCVSSTRVHCVLHAKFIVNSLMRNGFMAYVLHTRPMILVFIASISVMLAVFVGSLVVPRVLAGSVDENSTLSQFGNGNLLQKVIKMLPPNILTVFQGFDLLKTVVNTVFLDAGFYIVIMVTYQLLPLAYDSK